MKEYITVDDLKTINKILDRCDDVYIIRTSTAVKILRHKVALMEKKEIATLPEVKY